MVKRIQYSLEDAFILFKNIIQDNAPSPVPEHFYTSWLENMHINHYQKNDIYCKEGELNTKTGLVLEGCAMAYNTQEEGKKSIIKFFLKNDFVSSDDAQDGGFSDRTIVFGGDTIVLTIQNLPALYASSIAQNIYPDVQSIFLSFYQKEMANSRKISALRGITDTKNRIRAFYQQFGELDQHFNTSDIASFIGMARETFSRYKNEVLKSL